MMAATAAAATATAAAAARWLHVMASSARAFILTCDLSSYCSQKIRVVTNA